MIPIVSATLKQQRLLRRARRSPLPTARYRVETDTIAAMLRKGLLCTDRLRPGYLFATIIGGEIALSRDGVWREGEKPAPRRHEYPLNLHDRHERPERGHRR